MNSKEKNAQTTIGAGVLTFYDNKILLVQLNYGKFKGHWILPGGMVEKNEHPIEAAIREFKEETNLEISISYLLAIRNRATKGILSNIFFVFAGNIKDGQNMNSISWPKEELISVQFWTLEDALSSDKVRPLTKIYIQASKKMINNKFFEMAHDDGKDAVYLCYS